MAKLLFVGDVHLVRSQPNTRTDDFLKTQVTKMQFIYDYALNNECQAIYQVGDLFDTWRSTIEQSIYFSKIFKQFKSSYLADIPFYAVVGNHEAKYHNVDKEDSIFDLMVANDHIVHVPSIEHDNVDIHICDWGKKIPIPTEGKQNILVIHAGITEEPLTFDTKGEIWYTAKDLLKESGFDFIFSGHNHHNFEVSYRKKRLINIGAMWRKTRGESKHEPCFYTLDTNTWKYEKILIPVKPFRKIYTSPPREYIDAKNNVSFATFVDKINNDKDISLDFYSTLDVLMKEQSVEGDVTEIIYNMTRIEEDI
jgi:DNA repair exonuclease SbcCD nuclease subunit